MRRIIVLVSAVLALHGCAAVRQQKAMEPVSDNAEFKNLKVLQPNLTRAELIGVMQGFTRGLGVRCDHCHERIEGGGERDFDFAADTKPEKNVARTMLRMVRTINADYVARVNEHGQTVSCATCHRGKPVPAVETDAPAH